jgi:hypothetical protein
MFENKIELNDEMKEILATIEKMENATNKDEFLS